MSCLMSNDWISSLPQYLHQKISKGRLPKDLFFKTIQNGFLYHLGNMFFDQLFNIIDDAIYCDIYQAYQASDIVFWLINKSGLEDSKALMDLFHAIDIIDGIFCDVPNEKQDSEFHSSGVDVLLQDSLIGIQKYYKQDIIQLRDIYAKNYADRAFHDRQMCEYITFSLQTAYKLNGYPFLGENNILCFDAVKRKRWPAWVMPRLLSRSRGHCANCNANFLELDEMLHIDHIVPISKGGCNDLVNLQLLCSSCNWKKHNNLQLVNSSIPQYFKTKRTKK